MWPIPTLDNDIVTFSFYDDALVCSWIEKKHGHINAHVKAYQRHSLEHLELEKLILFNPTHIKNIMIQFLCEYKKHNAFIACSFHGTSIVEYCIALAISTPKREDFSIPHSSTMLWNYQYLYQNEDGQFVFYVYKMPQFLLLQYKLLAIAVGCNVITMTTQSLALLHCYKNIFGTVFRQSQLAVDMMRHNNHFEHIISTDMLQRTISMPTSLSLKKELPYLATSYGLFINQGLL